MEVGNVSVGNVRKNDGEVFCNRKLTDYTATLTVGQMLNADRFALMSFKKWPHDVLFEGSVGLGSLLMMAAATHRIYKAQERQNKAGNTMEWRAQSYK